MNCKSPYPLIVIGAGNFGTCLAQHLASLGHSVSMWTRSKDVAEHINRYHRNPKYLQEIDLEPQLKAFSDSEFSIENKELFRKAKGVILATPTQSLREVLVNFKKLLSPDHLLVCAAKGIEVKTHKLPSQIVADALGQTYASNMVSLSGPSFAIEVAKHLPTGVSMASENKERVLLGQEIFHAPYFRAYTSDDPIGLEICGALKNVIALGAGACEGLGFQANSSATLITRGLAEITRIGVALGANPLTFIGLGGVGDLFLTCSSKKSRNYTVGYRLGCGEKLQDVLNTVGSVAEGVTTARSAYNMCSQMGLRIPITTCVYRVLYENEPIEAAVQSLLTRSAKDERT